MKIAGTWTAFASDDFAAAYALETVLYLCWYDNNVDDDDDDNKIAQSNLRRDCIAGGVLTVIFVRWHHVHHEPTPVCHPNTGFIASLRNP